MQCISVQSNDSKTFEIIQAFQLCLSNKMSCHSSNFVTLFIGTRFAPIYDFQFCSSLTSKTLQNKKYHRIGKDIANHIVNFNSYKLCLSDILVFDGQEYWT